MFSLFKSSLYKLFKEKTFLITLIIGTALGVLIPLFTYLVVNGLGEDVGGLVTTGGDSYLVSSVSVGNNFGLTVPINLAVVTIAEFTTGTLRNKIIAGYRKSEIYLSLLFSGLVFTILLMAYYIAINVLMGTILNGFDANRIGGSDFILPYFAITICCYIFVTTLSIFIATTLRNIGATIPIIILTLLFLSILSSILVIAQNDETTMMIIRWVNPLQVLNQYSGMSGMFNDFDLVGNKCLAPGILSPLAYSVLFVGFGIFEFSKRDIK